MRPIDQETAATEKAVCYSEFPRGTDTPGQVDRELGARASVVSGGGMGEDWLL